MPYLVIQLSDSAVLKLVFEIFPDKLPLIELEIKLLKMWVTI